jgi:hypothetical protein
MPKKFNLISFFLFFKATKELNIPIQTHSNRNKVKQLSSYHKKIIRKLGQEEESFNGIRIR